MMNFNVLKMYLQKTVKFFAENNKIVKYIHPQQARKNLAC